MADEPDQHQDRPTQRLPKTGLEIPIPKRKDVMDAIMKVSEPDEDEQDDQPPIVDEDSA
jgi:hypothetical protein